MKFYCFFKFLFLYLSIRLEAQLLEINNKLGSIVSAVNNDDNLILINEINKEGMTIVNSNVAMEASQYSALFYFYIDHDYDGLDTINSNGVDISEQLFS